VRLARSSLAPRRRLRCRIRCSARRAPPYNGSAAQPAVVAMMVVPPQHTSSMALLLLLVVVAVTVHVAAAAAPTPTRRFSVAFVLTDDQDLTLNSLDYMPKTRRLLGGIEFTNMFATTPVCCPSRSSYMSGMYQHNTRCLANSVGSGCDGPQARVWEAQSLAVHLRSAGYQTGFWGKYLNTYGTPAAGRGLAVPPGWAEWGGLVGNSKYYK
jgi:N-acetylglucosamine-6-sulfatase